MKIENQISRAVIAAVKELYAQEVTEAMVQLQKTKSTFEGNYTLVVFPFLKISRKKPEDTAQEIGEYIAKHCEAVADFNVVKGFLNLVIAAEAWISLLNDIHSDDHFGEKPVTEASPLVMVEYSSPNTGQWQSRNQDQYRERSRYPHLQINVGVAEMGQRRDARNEQKERRSPDRRLLCGL